MDRLPKQNNAKNQSGKKSGKTENFRNTQQVKPLHKDNRLRGVLSDAIFQFLAAMAIVCWMLSEFASVLHVVFLFAAIILGLADAFYILAHKILVNRIGASICWIVFVCLFFLIFIVGMRTTPIKSPTPPMPLISATPTNLMPTIALQTLAAKLQENADDFFTQMAQEKSNETVLNEKLIAAQSATEPRTITEEQRRSFIGYLHSEYASKMFIPVIVGNADSETIHFARQVREMLDVAGYGPGAPEEPPTQKSNTIFVTNKLVAPIPPIGQYGDLGINEIPGIYPYTGDTNWGQNNAELLAVYSNFSTNYDKNFGPEPAMFMVMNPTKNNPSNGKIWAYHPTALPQSVMLGISAALIESGISVKPMTGDSFLPKGQVAIFVPQKFY